jgi:hypothetical protein
MNGRRSDGSRSIAVGNAFLHSVILSSNKIPAARIAIVVDLANIKCPFRYSLHCLSKGVFRPARCRTHISVLRNQWGRRKRHQHRRCTRLWANGLHRRCFNGATCLLTANSTDVRREARGADYDSGVLFEPVSNTFHALPSREGGTDLRPERSDLACLGGGLFRAPQREAVADGSDPVFGLLGFARIRQKSLYKVRAQNAVFGHKIKLAIRLSVRFHTVTP